MLEVHPPESIHGVKDFLLHIFTITVGLLIALGLEGCVEQWHRHELRREGETKLRQELQDNRKGIAEWLPTMKQEENTLMGVLDFLAAKKAGKEYDVSHLQMGFSIHSLSDASWRTAAATGALALMEYEQVQRYASAYQTQGEMMRLEQETLDDFLRLQSYSVYGFDPAKFTAADATAAEPEVRRALAHLEAMEQVAKGVTDGYDKALTGEDKSSKGNPAPSL